MRLVFFGTCGGIQTSESGNVSLLLVDERSSVLIDASGSPVQYLQKAGVDPRTLDTLVLTHSHPDHIYALPSLIHNLWLMKRERKLSILSNPFTLEKARELCACFSLLSRDGLFPIAWVEQGTVEQATERIALFPVAHSTPTSGVSIGSAGARIVYSADTAPCEAVVKAAEGARVLIHEASNGSAFEARLNAAGHSSGRQAGAAAREAGVERLFLCHFEPEYARDKGRILREARGAFSGEVTVPEPLASYEV